MGNWKERTVGDCFGGFASYMSNVASIEPYSEGIKKKFVSATSQKSKLPERYEEETLVKDFTNLAKKIIGVPR